MRIPFEQQTDRQVLTFYEKHGRLPPSVSNMSRSCIKELLDELRAQDAPTNLLLELGYARERSS